MWRFLPQWRVDGAVAYAHGTNEQKDQPLNSVSPLRASAGLTWEPSVSEGPGAALRWRGARAVTRTDDTRSYFSRVAMAWSTCRPGGASASAPR
jgi:hemoglobin/transferrin/lactoferrin receptor protein